MLGEYSLRAMLFLANEKDGTIVRISDIADEWDIPEKFLRKIIPMLNNAGLIQTIRGKNGGVRLAKNAEMITPLHILEAVEGEYVLHRCFIDNKLCQRSSWCAMHIFWRETQQKFKELLSSKTLLQLVEEIRESKRHLKQSARTISEMSVED